MRSYFDHNAIVQGRQRVRQDSRLLRTCAVVYNECAPALFMSADAIRDRRMQAHLMAPIARRAAFTFHA